MYVGTDIIAVDRIKRVFLNLNTAFLEKVFTEFELVKIDKVNPNLERASGFWAAKESLVKALGIGFSNGIRFHDIEIYHNEQGAPYFKLSVKLQKQLEIKGCSTTSLSISHCHAYATAVTIIY